MKRLAKFFFLITKKLSFGYPAGGHVEPNEDPKETVRRECLEELGVEADFLIPGPIFFNINVYC